MRKIELLAPAKNRDSAFAAIDYGADAIYIGASRFGARHAATNSVEDIAKVVEYAHTYGVRVHCTLNTLLFEEELREAEVAARELVQAGVDALIVQDMAYARMDLGVDLHASTQMCNMTPEGVRFLEQCGFSRVVLERALSLEQIRKIADTTSVELEAFVHGAICVGHSGRCYLSRSLSQRSGNRGECSQPCRLSYDLCDAAGRKLLSNKHLLSVRDLNLTSQIGAMLDAGVSSFKIEGRLKEIGYTKNIVAHYRTTIDEQLAQRPALVRSSEGESQVEFTPNPSKSFTRGESEYLFLGQRAGVASFDTPKARGEYIGSITGERAGRFRVKYNGQDLLHAGDGICFVGSDGFLGTNINIVEGEWFRPNRSEGLGKGVEIYRNFDKGFNDSLERSHARRTIAVDARLTGGSDHIELTYCDAAGNSATICREGEFAKALNAAKMSEVARTQVSKSGDTPFVVREITLGSELPFIAAGQLSQLRREALEELLRVRAARYTRPNAFVENIEAQLPTNELSAEYNVINSVARKFYTDHGAQSIEVGHDLSGQFDNQRVMQSSYCIRREIGECLREGSALREELYLERGGVRYRLEFDCKNCRMDLICME